MIVTPNWGTAMLQLSRTAFLLAFLLLLSSCGEAAERGEGGLAGSAHTDESLPYDSLLLAEEAEIHIGGPYSLRVVHDDEPSGQLREVWVSDMISNSILQFDGDGVFRRRIGQPGPGPHEFAGAGLLFLPNADEVGAVDHRRHEIKFFDRASGELRRFIRHELGYMGRSSPVAIDLGEPALLFPLLDLTSHTSLALLDVHTETWTHTGPFPGPFRRSLEQGVGAFPNLFPDVFVDSLDEAAVMVAFLGVDTVYRFDVRQREAQPIGKVPRLTRRGIEGECRFAYDNADYLKKTDCVMPSEQFSRMRGAWVLRDGRIAVVHADLTGTGRPPARVYTSVAYLSTLDRNSDVACVDMPVPGADDAGAFSEIEGDVLYALDRRFKGENLETWLLEIPVPSMAECPEGHLVNGWLVEGGGEEGE
jgi:hypothetical protein